jgi:amphi-Trp domain-containing protein
MAEETLHEERTPRKRRRIASFFGRFADRPSRGERVGVDDDEHVAVDVPAESEMEVSLERDGEDVSLDIELEWTDEDEATVDTDVVASKARFEVYPDSTGDRRWRLVHRNGNVIADSGEGYASTGKAEQGLESVRANAPGAYVIDPARDETVPAEGGSKATFELFADSAGKWRWRLRHDNGNIIADSGQGYASKQGLHSVQTNTPGAPVEDADADAGNGE